MKPKIPILNRKAIFQVIYLALLAVLLPHTKWAFWKFEPQNAWGAGVAWAAAFFFEATLWVLTIRLAERLSRTPNYQAGHVAWRKFRYRYLNPYSTGLLIAVLVSTAANLAHAVEFGQELKIFAAMGISPLIYSAAFGAILPLSSLVFAWVLSNEQESEGETSPELIQAKANLTELRRQLRESEDGRRRAEERFEAAGDLFAALFAEEKRQRILAARQQWPTLTAAAIAVIAGASPSYVSEVLEDGK